MHAQKRLTPLRQGILEGLHAGRRHHQAAAPARSGVPGCAGAPTLNIYFVMRTGV
jgi:hypothetical protein